MMKEQPAEPHPPQQLSATDSMDGPPLTNTTSNATTTTTTTTRRILDDEDEMNQSVNFLTNQYTTTARQDAIHASRSNNTSSTTSRSSSFGINETQQQQYHHQQQQQNINRTHTTGETKLSKIFIRVVFGSCMFSIFTTLVRSQLYTLPRTTRHQFCKKNSSPAALTLFLSLHIYL